MNRLREIRCLATAVGVVVVLGSLLAGCGGSSAVANRTGSTRGAVVPVRVGASPRGAVVVLAPV
ncbi:MAG: hypothetical protein ACRDPA_07975, partial [Solirubrobacteraceae bacterium]